MSMSVVICLTVITGVAASTWARLMGETYRAAALIGLTSALLPWGLGMIWAALFGGCVA